ncbi:uncharacterized protein LOC110720868 [Chenopodium quinoa]|uniref:Uncharacterized protein n=1 Tax=Chenopodium quinoa TaxID=63459 RepID=A0A803LXX4_CHEQI|nr:uncharacterized protein LOC110720868 [Chenopodium quinoa]
MRREGRPHGMVRTYHILPSPLNPRPTSRIVNPVNTPPTAGLFTKVNNKPTNHSKFTGKCEKSRCAGCHLHPSWKSKVKSKGALKLKNADAELDYRHVTFRVMGSNKLRDNGYSASGILDELNIHYHHNHDLRYDDHGNYYDDDGDDDGDDDEKVGIRQVLIETTSTHSDVNDDVHVHDVVKNDDDDDVMVDKDDDDVIIHAGVTDDGDDGYMGFYDVAYVLNHVDEDEGWSIVGDDKI